MHFYPHDIINIVERYEREWEREREWNETKKKWIKDNQQKATTTNGKKRTFYSSELLLNRIDCVRHKHTLLNTQTILFFFLYSFSFYYFISFIVWSANCLEIFYEIFHLFQSSFRTDYDSLCVCIVWEKANATRHIHFEIWKRKSEAQHCNIIFKWPHSAFQMHFLRLF